MTDARIGIQTLTKLDELSLKETIPDCTIERLQPDAQEHGDLGATIAIVTITLAALATFATWLAKNRSKSNDSWEFEKVLPDGTRERHIIKFDRSSSTSDSEVVEQLAKIYKIDPTTLQKQG